VVLLDEFATDIPRAWLLKINDLRLSKFPVFQSLRASNQGVGGSNPSGRALYKCFSAPQALGRETNSSNRRQTTRPFDKLALRRLGRRRAAAEDEGPQAEQSVQARNCFFKIDDFAPIGAPTD
jgi:hypothetical protein